MASLLNYGAGAYAGLEDIMDRDYKRQVAERLLAAEQETSRHNKAEEGIQGKTLDQNAQLRGDAQKSLDESRITNATNMKRDDIRARVGMMAPGDKVSPEQYKEDTTVGMVPAGRYKETPGQYQPLPNEQQGPAQEPPSDFEFLGMPVKPGAEKSPPNMHTETVKYKGKVVDANYHPDTGRYTLPTGEDITGQFEHYEKPTQPIGIWTDQGYVDRNAALRDARGGHPAQPQDPANIRTRRATAQQILPKIKEARTMADNLDRAGLFGPAMSRLRQAASKVGTIEELQSLIGSDPEIAGDREVGRFASHMALLASGAAIAHYQGRAGSSQAAVQAFKDMVTDASTPEMFQGRLDALDDFMGGYASGHGGDAGGGGGVPSVGGTFQGGKVLKVTPIQ